MLIPIVTYDLCIRLRPTNAIPYKNYVFPKIYFIKRGSFFIIQPIPIENAIANIANIELTSKSI